MYMYTSSAAYGACCLAALTSTPRSQPLITSPTPAGTATHTTAHLSTAGLQAASLAQRTRLLNIVLCSALGAPVWSVLTHCDKLATPWSAAGH
jgi:hypothetical protein